MKIIKFSILILFFIYSSLVTHPVDEAIHYINQEDISGLEQILLLSPDNQDLFCIKQALNKGLITEQFLTDNVFKDKIIRALWASFKNDNFWNTVTNVLDEKNILAFKFFLLVSLSDLEFILSIREKIDEIKDQLLSKLDELFECNKSSFKFIEMNYIIKLWHNYSFLLIQKEPFYTCEWNDILNYVMLTY